MSTPSKGAMCAVHELWAVLPTTESDARIIDSHTNAIADELAAALKSIQSECGGHCDEFSGNVWRKAESALARYQQLKNKETS